jgi:hypothetical protein
MDHEIPANLRDRAVPTRVTLGGFDATRGEVFGELVAEGTRCPPWEPFPRP